MHTSCDQIRTIWFHFQYCPRFSNKSTNQTSKIGRFCKYIYFCLYCVNTASKNIFAKKCFKCLRCVCVAWIFMTWHNLQRQRLHIWRAESTCTTCYYSRKIKCTKRKLSPFPFTHGCCCCLSTCFPFTPKLPDTTNTCKKANVVCILHSTTFPWNTYSSGNGKPPQNTPGFSADGEIITNPKEKARPIPLLFCWWKKHITVGDR